MGGNTKRLCTIAGVSSSGYYRWQKTAHLPDRDRADYVRIKNIFDAHRKKYGHRRIYMALLDQGIHMNHKKVARIMKKYGLVPTVRKRSPYRAIMKRTAEHRTCANTLDRAFTQTSPYQFFCTDITYIPYNGRFAYLSVVKDIASGEVVAWQLSRHVNMELVMDTMDQMRAYEHALIHSDQGFHYTSPAYIEKVKALDMVQSMSRKGTCIDNAPIESFFGHLKDEIDYRSAITFEELHTMISDYMSYYNNDRRQWTRNKMTPVAYRDHLLAQR